MDIYKRTENVLTVGSLLKKIAPAIVTVTLLQTYISLFTPNVAGRERGK